MFLMKRIALSVFAAVICLNGVLQAQVYDTPEKANEDEDFSLQGEYTDSTRGLQVIALGDGEFRVVVYTDGLPGAGWNGKDKQQLDLDADALESMVSKFKRIERKSLTLGSKPPVGAVVLFDGSADSLKTHWKKGARRTEDGSLMEGCTSIDTFGDYTMHLEFRLPFMPKARGQGRGNSGCIIRADTKHRCWIPLDWKEKTTKQAAFIRSSAGPEYVSATDGLADIRRGLYCSTIRSRGKKTFECQDHGETQRRCHSSGCRVASHHDSARERISGRRSDLFAESWQSGPVQEHLGTAA